jgi:hypothetical protein
MISYGIMIDDSDDDHDGDDDDDDVIIINIAACSTLVNACYRCFVFPQ